MNRQGSPSEVFRVFLRLGLTSFGGPIAHLGYFRDELVTRRRWLDDAAYADLVALCQFLPGPASSQVGFALGLMRAGWRGAAAAFLAFTLPSALILMIFAMGWGAGGGALAGLKIVAVAIVAQAVLGMARTLCPDRERASIAVMAVVLLALLPTAVGMIGAIIAGAAAGLALGRGQARPPAHAPRLAVTRRQSLLAAIAFVLLLILGTGLFGGFFRAGALVFGGGHVVLPLLEQATVAQGWLSHDSFLAGYGAAQAVPGPLFTFAAYLGMAIDGIPGAVIALAAIFLPGFLILIAALPHWDRLRQAALAQSAMQGANAAVVGILGAALYDPVFTGGIGDMGDFALALAGFVALVAWRMPPWVVVAASAAVGALMV
ncbi:chromate efflux transporter [Paracoccus sp. 1_MG-2023]|uniref:chromate efflux transporter n=1 Tax=unclassified Paracoccus (in: a-proteobacteria) TaxID=2688777 RepID=UPI001C095DAF|nr:MULTISPECIES: chromate efflux transporter [unclassified Paracoccus (in: a-proteobacteria)]MBU2958120.1 chromate efflux transporter [Paracoccus sp. C2R09]MDO6669294.1 chromate efflux transporter [Paracoccus sp. 1_MG-2023]